MPKKTFETMNGLRGLAALIIVIWHNQAAFGVLRAPRSYLAVDLFFVLSGFVIAYSYENRISKGLGVRDFFIIRMIRLYPIYALGTVIIPIVIATASFVFKGHITEGGSSRLYSIPFSILMLPTPSFHDLSTMLYPLNPPAWSLFFEIIINVIYVASWKWWSNRNISIVMFISAAVLVLSNDFFAVEDGWGAGGFTWQSMPFGLLRVFYSFPAGVLIYRVVCRNNNPLPHFYSLIALAVFPLFLIWPAAWACTIVMLIGIPLLVVVAAKSEPKKIIGRICSVLGSASYAVYALHEPMMELIQNILTKLGIDIGPQVLGYAYLITIIPVCLLIDKLFDAPVRQWMSRKFLRPSI